MATIVFISAFVWFFMMSPPEQGLVEAYQPKKVNDVSYSESKQPNSILVKLKSFIRQKNPKLPNNDVDEIAFWIHEYAKEEDMDPMLVAALIGRESSFQKNAVSKTGAKGLGQIKDFNFKDLDIEDPFNIQQNVRGTVKYLKHLFSVWKGSKDKTELALASYYQGPNATKKKKHRLPSKVTGYVDDVLNSYQSLKK